MWSTIKDQLFVAKWFLRQLVSIDKLIYYPFHAFQISLYAYHGLPFGHPWFCSERPLRGHKSNTSREFSFAHPG
jgi:hypothetical protein